MDQKLQKKTRDQDFSDELVALLPRLWRFAQSLTGARDVSHDLVQATCERALRCRHQWRPGTRLDSWLFRILHSIWKNELRARKLRDDADLPHLTVFPPHGPSEHPEARLALRELCEAVFALPEAQRLAVLLVYVEGYAYREAAEILDIPLGTVMSRLARARMKLTDQFQTRDPSADTASSKRLAQERTLEEEII